MNFFDLHCDTAFEAFRQKTSFSSKQLSVSFKAANMFDNWTQTYAIWIKDDLEFPFEKYRLILENMRNELAKAPSNLTPIFAVEGAALLESDIERVALLAEDKIKFLTLTWNGENKLAGGVDSEKGLTKFGKRVINKLNEYHIGCDLSHLNKKSFYSAFECAEFPLATHSNCYELCKHPRNLTIKQMLLIAEKGGIIGLTFYPEFLFGNVKDAIYENILLMCENGLQENISIGSDFDGAKMSENLKKTQDIPALYEYLHEKGLNYELLNLIFYKNAQNYIAKL